MLHLDIQKGNEAMKTSTNSKCSGRYYCVHKETSYCYQRVWPADIKRYLLWWYLVQFCKNFWGDGGSRSWLFRAGEDDPQGFLFSYIIKVDEILTGRVVYCFEEYSRISLWKTTPGHWVKYNYMKVLGFIATKGAGSTEPGDPYISCFHDIYSNVSVRPVVRPHLLGRYFNACNAIYNNSRMWQSDI